MKNEAQLSLNIIKLDHLGLIRILGPDRSTFLQGQLTSDITKLTPMHPMLGACCDPKGRMQANFWVFMEADAIYFLLPKNMIEITLKHLKKYAVFSKVTLEAVTTDFFIFGLIGNEIKNQIEPQLTNSKYHLLKTTGERWLLIVTQNISATTDQDKWDALDIENGFCLLQPETSSLFTPQMLNWQKQGGVDFKKGCYLGQEIVARTEHLGKLKRHLYRATVSAESSMKIGTSVVNEKKEVIGTVVLINHSSILAVIEDRAIDQLMKLENVEAILTHVKFS